jgi:hypothetical protein
MFQHLGRKLTAYRIWVLLDVYQIWKIFAVVLVMAAKSHDRNDEKIHR